MHFPVGPDTIFLFFHLHHWHIFRIGFKVSTFCSRTTHTWKSSRSSLSFVVFLCCLPCLQVYSWILAWGTFPALWPVFLFVVGLYIFTVTESTKLQHESDPFESDPTYCLISWKTNKLHYVDETLSGIKIKEGYCKVMTDSHIGPIFYVWKLIIHLCQTETDEGMYIWRTLWQCYI